ncbi:hypothetical protein FDENT_11903 [Fusarium denticulatum]|uniref:Uncharacterized protein n=1 Tax=Fusarium denticulatum TaxID=48507 RepID=A0A8H5TGW2_9HYPO|nr:hypothetical protein FDENT_11903 [Fusarium denticulatum]
MAMSLFTYALIIASLFAPALTAATGGTPRGQFDGRDFDPVHLKTLFPEGHIPSDTSDLQYGIILVGDDSKSGTVDPVSSGSGVLLAVGESHGLVQLQKRDGQPDPFVFLDCPTDVLDQPVNQTQKARVVCTNEDVDGCFRVRERGVEGTLVEMPEECAPNSFARAISLKLAEDQTMPDHLAKRHTPTSPIYEFSFDFNQHERRTDAEVAIRMDITNVKGHWDGVVDSPGIKKSHLERRYFSPDHTKWKENLQGVDRFHYGSGENSLKVQKKLTTPVFTQAAGNSSIEDKHYGIGIAAFVEGKVDAKMSYGVTVIATSTRGTSKVDIKEATGFIKVTGQTDLTFGVCGWGHLNISMAGKGSPTKSEEHWEAFQRHTINAGAFWGYMSLTPFMIRNTFWATSHMDGVPSNRHNHTAPVTFNGRLTTRVKTDLGEFPAAFPHVLFPDEMDSLRKSHKETEMESLNDNILYRDGGEEGSSIQIGHNLTFGLSVGFGIYPDVQGPQPNHESNSTFLLVTSETYANWDIPPAENGQVCPRETASSLLRQGVIGRKLPLTNPATQLTVSQQLIKRASDPAMHFVKLPTSLSNKTFIEISAESTAIRDDAGLTLICDRVEE